MPKRAFRDQLLARRRHFSAAGCFALSLAIQDRLLASAAYRQAGSIGLYSPMLNEVQTERVARRCLADGKRLSYPRVSGATLEFVEVLALEQLNPGHYGILEPSEGRVLAVAELELLVIPGVAFDLCGYRLGYGKGFYDRTLALCPPTVERVGFAYEFQVVERLPVDPHDCRLTRLVTEQRMLHFPP